MSSLDLNSIDTVAGSNDGFDVRLYHPGTHEDLDIIITVLGKDSDEFNKVTRAQSKKRMAKMSKNGFRSNMTSIPIEEVEQDNITLLAACTKQWIGVVLEGKELECTQANAYMIYDKFPWIREQIDTAIGDRANFIRS